MGNPHDVWATEALTRATPLAAGILFGDNPVTGLGYGVSCFRLGVGNYRLTFLGRHVGLAEELYLAVATPAFSSADTACRVNMNDGNFTVQTYTAGVIADQGFSFIVLPQPNTALVQA